MSDAMLADCLFAPRSALRVFAVSHPPSLTPGASYGPLATTCVDVDLHILGDFYLVSAAMSAGVCLGAGLDLSTSSELHWQDASGAKNTARHDRSFLPLAFSPLSPAPSP